MERIHDLNVESFKPLITPKQIRHEIPIPESALRTVVQGRKVIRDIVEHKDPRKFVVVGPCSIHDPDSAKEYAAKLLGLARKVEDKLFLVMRAYFEKPRTTVGWKGYINDPFLDNTFNINEGLLRSRKLLCQINEMGMPVGTEALEPISPQYLSELICWTAIGARTTESQSHREMASGLSSPVGFKNNTDGNVHVAINAIKSAARSHHFLGIDHEGRTSIVATRGNSHCHLILRGGGGRPNYDSVSVKLAEEALVKAGLNSAIVVDCSHDNSNKQFALQPMVLEDCIGQIANGNKSLVGFMVESHLYEGSQHLSNDLKYGVSITDGCVSWEVTEEMILRAYNRLGE
jgi:3-deoxy-7-phosphoheptulonate synthase